MSSTTVQIAHSSGMGIYEPPQQYNMWKDVLKGSSSSASIAPSIVRSHTQPQEQFHYPPQQSNEFFDSEDTSGLEEKIQRRLAQNREAARKSRQRKKAYVQELEVSRLKLAQVEQELERVKSNQGSCVGNDSSSLPVTRRSLGNINAGITAFEMEFAHWNEERQKKNYELRNALQSNVADVELTILVDGYLSHMYQLFEMKADIARADVFYLISGTWRTSVERFFHWIGGFRPSDLLNVITQQMELVSEEQGTEISKLKTSCEQAEYALSQGLDRLQQTLGLIMTSNESSNEGYERQMISAMENLEAVEGFVSQADHLRKQSLLLISRILNPNQAARGLLSLGDYFHRLSALSTIWAARPRDNAAVSL